MSKMERLNFTTTVRMNKQLHEVLRQISFKQNIPINDIIIKAIESEVNKIKKEAVK